METSEDHSTSLNVWKLQKIFTFYDLWMSTMHGIYNIFLACSVMWLTGMQAVLARASTNGLSDCCEHSIDMRRLCAWQARRMEFAASVFSHKS